ncbi:MAG: O-antigen ligase family protein [Candidatus Omnitrophica bacterium]|nr:O-antigen ligase family protein [Candidatus Omnitrophota bacterium]
MAVKYLDYALYWSIVLFPFSIAIAPGFTFSLLGIMCAAFAAKKIIKKEPFIKSTPINLPFLLLILISILSFKNSVNLNSSVKGIFKLIESAAVFLICAQEIKDRKHISRIILFMVLGAVLASCDALWQNAFGKDFIRGNELIINIGLKRSTAAFPDANVLGVYLSPIAPVAFAMALYYLKGRKKLLMFAAAFTIVAGITLTFSRPTALALVLSLLFLGIVKKDKIVLITLLILAAIAPVIAPQNIKDWAKSVNYNPVIFMTNYDRISIYRNTLNMIGHHPVLGVGVNTFSLNYSKYKLPEAENAKTSESVYAHNNFLHMAGEIGLIGLGVFIWLLFRLFKSCAATFKGLKDNYLKIVSLAVTASLLAFMINGLTETSLYYAKVVMIFWFTVGLCFALKEPRFQQTHGN